MTARVRFVRPALDDRLALAALALLVVLTRGWIVGDPVVNIDEQFYMVVGDRLLHGELPYLHTWDRKPPLLFAIYAAGAALSRGLGLLPAAGYQLLAMAAVLATTGVLYAMARRLVGVPAALAGAAAYPCWLLVFGGVGGQSPVFYNLPMTLAAALLLRGAGGRADAPVTRPGIAAMLLVGLAIQIKYTAVFEGIFFGLSLLWRDRRRQRGLGRMAVDALAWIAAALAPTAAAFALYAALGAGPAFAQANFFSVFGDSNPELPALERLAALTFGLFPLWIAMVLARRHWRSEPGAPGAEARWLWGWAIAAYLGFLPFGVWNDHYTLPLLPPLALMTALAVQRVRRPRALAALVLGLGLAGGLGRAIADVTINGTRGEIAAVGAAVAPHLHGGCLYVNEDLVVLHTLTGACPVTRWLFPQHLALHRYAHALGTDPHGELARVMAAHPAVVVASLDPDEDTDPVARRILLAALARDYRRYAVLSVGGTPYALFERAATR